MHDLIKKSLRIIKLHCSNCIRSYGSACAGQPHKKRKMETNTESSFFVPLLLCLAGCTGGAGVRAALTMGDGVERGGAGAGQSTQRPAGTHT